MSLGTWLPLLAAVAGCSDSATAPQPFGPAFVQGPGGPTSTCVPKQCNAIVNDGPMVSPEIVAAAPPAPMGGTLVDGKWALTAYTAFTGPGGQPISLGELDWVSVVWAISGANIEYASASRSEDQPDTPGTGTYAVSVSGTSLTLQTKCPCTDASVEAIAFTGTQSQLQLFVPATGATVALTFAKQ